MSERYNYHRYDFLPLGDGGKQTGYDLLVGKEIILEHVSMVQIAKYIAERAGERIKNNDFVCLSEGCERSVLTETSGMPSLTVNFKGIEVSDASSSGGDILEIAARIRSFIRKPGE